MKQEFKSRVSKNILIEQFLGCGCSQLWWGYSVIAISCLHHTVTPIMCRGFVCKGFVGRGLVCRGFVCRGFFVYRGFFVCTGLVLSGFVYRGLVCRRFVCRGFVCCGFFVYRGFMYLILVLWFFSFFVLWFFNHLVAEERTCFCTGLMLEHVENLPLSIIICHHSTGLVMSNGDSQDGFSTGTPRANNMGLVARKPVFGISDKVSFKPVSTATGTSQKMWQV